MNFFVVAKIAIRDKSQLFASQAFWFVASKPSDRHIAIAPLSVPDGVL